MLRRTPKSWHKWFPPNLLAPGIRQGLFGSGTTENAFFIELTDGGHFDNTGLYELIRRRVRIIVLSQGSQDLGYSMDDLANAIQRVRVDFGVHIRFTSETYPLGAMRPGGARCRGQTRLGARHHQVSGHRIHRASCCTCRPRRSPA